MCADPFFNGTRYTADAENHAPFVHEQLLLTTLRRKPAAKLFRNVPHVVLQPPFVQSDFASALLSLGEVGVDLCQRREQPLPFVLQLCDTSVDLCLPISQTSVFQPVHVRALAHLCLAAMHRALAFVGLRFEYLRVFFALSAVDKQRFGNSASAQHCRIMGPSRRATCPKFRIERPQFLAPRSARLHVADQRVAAFHKFCIGRLGQESAAVPHKNGDHFRGVHFRNSWRCGGNSEASNGPTSARWIFVLREIVCASPLGHGRQPLYLQAALCD
mmetsp:Transcript_13259/g.35514  ORF Transcript_13259/g.35514 Transcript_13259/m.35514 type:complete len:273 (-) Transcript_13259:796-1614(-)